MGVKYKRDIDVEIHTDKYIYIYMELYIIHMELNRDRDIQRYIKIDRYKWRYRDTYR